MDPVQIILGIAALLVAVGIIVKSLRRAIRVVALVEDAAPTVLAIAKQFEDSRGADLREKLDLAIQTSAEASDLSRQRTELLLEVKGTLATLSEKQSLYRHKTSGTLSMLTDTVSKNLKDVHEINLELARRGVRLDRLEANMEALSDLRELLKGDLEL